MKKFLFFVGLAAFSGCVGLSIGCAGRSVMVPDWTSGMQIEAILRPMQDGGLAVITPLRKRRLPAYMVPGMSQPQAQVAAPVPAPVPPAAPSLPNNLPPPAQ